MALALSLLPDRRELVDLGRAARGEDVMVKPPTFSTEGIDTSSHCPGRNCYYACFGVSWASCWIGGRVGGEAGGCAADLDAPFLVLDRKMKQPYGTIGGRCDLVQGDRVDIGFPRLACCAL